jgi:hypothetical protein
MRGAGWVVMAVAGWALMFGDPKTDGAGWKQIDVFASSATCEDERQERAREVRDKTTTNQPLDVVLQFYRCIESH